MNAVKVGLLGLGIVGGGTAVVLQRNQIEIARRAGRGIQPIVAATLHPQWPNPTQLTLTADAQAVVDDPQIDIVVEVMGGLEPARTLVLRAIANGKHIVTANKALIANHGNEIFAAAQEKGVMVAFEAAVAGGIPVIKALREGLAANHLQAVAGIINGTSNYILTAMAQQGKSFAEALQTAQTLGYAEADPTFDIQGVDAAHKLAILASIAFGIPLQFPKVHIEGITEIQIVDVGYAAHLGYTIKHLGIARRRETGVEMRVHPALVPTHQILANVNGVMNAVLVKGDAVGETLFYGPGAGAEATGSAIVADLVDVVRTMTVDPEHRVPHLAFQPNALKELPILSSEQFETAFYLRLQALDKPGVMADITGILAKAEISIEAILQKEPADSLGSVPVILLTQRVREGAMNGALSELQALPSIVAPIVKLRVENLAFKAA